MNIREAKEEIIRAVNAYRRKDETGVWEIPADQQRPILLIGPPGIGKTAVMRQIAEECGIGLVSYTITHHTRQSAIGLPVIAHRTFGGEDYTVTEYTMSEIVASVYEKIEKTGLREGILFLDEINCVSETLAPAMLQLLQYKTFGTHRVPDGWLIATAGNQPQYNRSAREFDIVTLDRIKKMEIEADLAVWKEYAGRAGIHGAVLSYLNLKPQNFYVIRTELDGRHFVTARGWEDLSRMLYSYEKMGEPVTERLTAQYLQDEEIAKDFTLYFDLYHRYRDRYQVRKILAGAPVTDPESLRDIPFDEKYSLIRLLTDGLHSEFVQFAENQAVQETLYRQLVRFRETPAPEGGLSLLRDFGGKMRRNLSRREEAEQISREEARHLRLACRAWEELTAAAAGQSDDPSSVSANPAAVQSADSCHISADPATGISDSHESVFAFARDWFAAREDARQARMDETNLHLTHAFSFLDQVYGSGQEIVMFLTELNADWYCLQFVRSCGNEAYERCNRLLLVQDKKEELRREILRMRL